MIRFWKSETLLIFTRNLPSIGTKEAVGQGLIEFAATSLIIGYKLPG